MILTAGAATSEDFSYTVAGDEVTITRYNGSNTTVSLLESKRQEIETDIQNTLNEFSKLN